MQEPATAEELHEEISALPSAQREGLRRAAKHDLYFLSRGVLGYDAMTEHTHAAACNFLMNAPRERRLFLMPRGHFKSSIATIADSIRLSLLDPDHARILIVNETATNAEGFLSEIKAHWENNDLLRDLFPELVPARLTGPGSQWSSVMATLQRKTAYKEGTYTAIGVGGAATSRHYTRIKADDLIGLEADRSPAVMMGAIKWVNQIEPLLTAPDQDIIDFIGTRWSLIDLYQNIISGYQSDLAIFSRMATDTGEPEGVPIFPERYSTRRFQRIKLLDPKQWYAQYCNNPIADGARDFDPGMLRNYWWTRNGEIEYREGDTTKRWPLEALYRTIQVDPNSGSTTAPDTAAIVCCGVSPDDEVFTLESFSGRPNPDAFINRIWEMCQKWKPEVVGIEKAGQQQTLWHFEKHMVAQKEYYRVEELHHKNIEKEQRIRTTIQPLLRQGKLFVPENMHVLRSSITNFPQIELWDELDALAYGPQVWRTGTAMADNEETDKVINTILRTRGRTGYGGRRTMKRSNHHHNLRRVK